MHAIWKSWSRELKQSLVDIFCLERDGWCLAWRALSVFPPFPRLFCLASPESCYVFGQLPSYLLLHSNCHRIRLIAQPCLSLPCTLTSREKTLQHLSPMNATPAFSLHSLHNLHPSNSVFLCISHLHVIICTVYCTSTSSLQQKSTPVPFFTYYDHILLPYFQSIFFLLLSKFYCVLCILFSLICDTWTLLFIQFLAPACWWHLTVASDKSVKEVYLYSPTPIYVRYISKPEPQDW